MNNYHIYEAIGRGKHSVVYKGRKKKTIEYYAIKSVEKSQRSKVLHAGKILHKLDHQNILKFYNWYETSAHLWLILEYCVGGDLMKLLAQDKRLPEDAIHDIAFDLMTALQYLHSKGIVFGDLKPSNILLDENGCAKLCDFGTARYVADTSTDSHSQAKRGTPYYMAPELFQDGGVHSYASDFWALGCVLYECYTSRPPFEGKEFTELVKSILSDPVSPINGNPSSLFSDLIDCLLQKDPAERIKWPQLCDHKFWKRKLAPIPLPSQPAFNQMLKFMENINGDVSAQQKTPVKHSIVQKINGSSGLRSKGSATPLKNPASRRALHSKTSGRTDDRQRGLNLVRMSRMAKLNVQRDNEKENYRRKLPKNSENDVEVKMENKDMELDFSEIQEEETPDDVDMPATTDLGVSNPDDPPVTEGDPNVFEGENFESTKDQQSESTTPECSSHDLFEVYWHSSDLSVRPIMPYRKTDKATESTPTLPFEAILACDYAKMPPGNLDLHNSQVVQCLNGNGLVSEKQNVIRYIEMLSGNADAATIITNGPIMMLLVKMLRLPKASALRVQLASAIGSLIRHSTSIQGELAASGIIAALTNGLRDKHDKVRRFSMAALGELLFYISTLSDQSKDPNALESPSKDNRSVSGWQVSSSVISLVSSMLQRGEDDLTQLYALRTVENICSQGSEWACRFASQDIIANICYIYKAIGKQESTKISAGSCLVRLGRFNPQSLPMIFEKISIKELASTITKGTPKEQQTCLNLLNTGLLCCQQQLPNMNRLLVALSEEKLLVPGLVSLVEQGTEILRGKSLIFIALLCKISLRWLAPIFCNAKMLPMVDRLAKERDSFVQKCVDTFLLLISSSVPDILENVSLEIQQMVGGKRQPRINSRSSTCHLFLVVLHLLGSSSFKRRILNHQILPHLANLTKHMESPFQGRDDFQTTLLRILESLSEESCIIQREPTVFLKQILPSLLIIYRGNKDGDSRFLCLKILFNVMVILQSEVPEGGEDVKSLVEAGFLPLYPSMIEDEDPIPMYAQKFLVMLIEFKHVRISHLLEERMVAQCFDFLLRDLSDANVSNVKLCLALTSADEMKPGVLSKLRVVKKIGNLLDFVNAKGMEDFLSPTLSLCKEFMYRAFGGDRAAAFSGDPARLIDAGVDESEFFVKDITDFSGKIGVFLELIENPDQNIADLASECLVLLFRIVPREATLGALTSLPRMNNVVDRQREGGSRLLLWRVLCCLVFSCRYYLSRGLILSLGRADVIRMEAAVSRLKSSSSHSGLATAAESLLRELQRLPRCI
ncbi:kinase family with ARM repeat domain-containing protein [Wolffia australiana]